ncbi:MAG: 6,7-dimethyl-8-ribityllumazine synthase [Candidatus Saganbacteria bacterium]|nr:6,7-dimethyl-8-ribityllumazine synthase [Candidatus Saganbacteria bacterium]
MVTIIEGNLNAEKFKFSIVISRFNEIVSHALLSGAIDCLKRHGASDKDITVVWVPGAYEIPQIAKKIASSSKIDTVICLGAVIRGGTPHFDYIAAEVSKGVAQVGLNSKVPVVFGVLTTDSLEQAIERAGAKGGNKGFNAALSAIELASLNEKI